ncbi:ATP-binding protein [Hymenobacter caeli]|uniref:histidine kinase n=1 Tax=Hymenobacter caeli TaxID=2735894 RepID=A0ABX2FRM4_9BACT|nr:HAMP domain-containing sensor histidine kinase [Hymenobacter caeli]NRT19097.1 signal transduction histidine kinase [Hymenobacter caeli]
MRKLLTTWRPSPVALLVLAGVFFTLGFLASRYGQLPGVVRRTDLRRLQQLVRAAETVASRDADAIAAQVPRGDYSFARLLATSYYPAFVLRDGKLRYWSSAELRPSADDLAGAGPERAVETTFGRFLLVRRRAGPWQVLVYVPLERHYGIRNRYLREGSTADVFQGLRLRVVLDSTAQQLPAFRSPQGAYLFSIKQAFPYRLTGQYVPLALLVLAVLLYAAGWGGLAWRYWRAGRAGTALLVVGGPLLLLRGALLYLGLPFSFIELPLFDPRVYAASLVAPSLGDLLVNALLAFGAAAGVGVLWVRSRVAERAPAPRGPRGQALAIAALGGLFWGLLWLLYVDYGSIFTGGQLSLDVTRGLPLTGFRVVLALALVAQTGAYLIGFFLLTQLAETVLQHVPERLLLLGTAGTAAVSLLLGLVLGQPLALLLGVLATFGALVRAARLRVGPAGGYQLGALGVLLGGLAATTGALALHEQFEQQLLADKQRLASSLLVDNDFQGEFLLEERINKIAADPFVRQALTGSFGRVESAVRRVDRQYLGDYFDKYESQVTLYDAAGQPLDAPAGTPSLAQAGRAIRRRATRTDQRGVYLLRADNSFSSRHYVALAAVGGPGPGGVGPALGTVRVDLTLKKLTSYSVLPELLVDQKFFRPSSVDQLSYAGYDRGRLVYSEGEFDYANRLPPARLRDPRLYALGLELGGYQHLAVRGAGQRTVVVTTATYSLADGLANFSFQFLLSAGFWLVLGGAYLLRRRRAGVRLRLNFSARIQLLLNAGIVVPLAVVSVATAGQLIASYRSDLMRTYERRGELALGSVRAQRRLLADTTARPLLAALARNVAALTETDINLYNARGELLASSQPLIFEAGLLGPLLNPEAVATLRERGARRALLTEQAGTLAFTALYLPVRASASEVADSAGYPLTGRRPRGAPADLLPDDAAGPIVGYLGIPFFDSAKNLDTKLTGLFTTLLNIVTVMFLLFLGLAFVAARQLTAPLKLITEKLTRTTLTGQNEPIPYRSSDDEIGLLVREYNAMLGKLEASRRELAAQEKEVAWREMARQVAHEIKNPLTPMKLSLQFLQRAIAERRPNAEELIGRISQTLITQVDVLSDIATSFSTFTNLPAMRPERLDVVAVLRRCADLFRQSDGDENGELRLALPPDGTYTVFADESLLVRTFNNLLLNAKQAVPPGRPPRQTVALRAAGPGQVLITIADNGAGIADDVRPKVFVPNFTTKEGGSGIGLAVAKRGIESAGGRLWFETVVGEGTQFFIELPLAG